MSLKSIQTCLSSSLLLVFLLFLQPAYAQYNWSELDKAVDSRQQLLGNDLVMMVWKDDSLLYKKELGGFNSKTQAPIASASKWLTAALVMQFVDEGKLSLDDKINKWLPEYEKYFKNFITVRHCLSHLTGIEEEDRFVKKLLQRKKFKTLEEEVNYFASKKIRANPSEDFWYGNIGLNIAGRILEIISKKKFDQLIKQKLFNPLAMRKTTFSELEGGAINPSGGAKSTADDYMQFLGMLLNKGKYKGMQLLSEKSVEELMKVQTKKEIIKYAPKSAEGFNYASGSWVLEEKNGKASTLASPGLFGTWPMIDFCRGYAYIVFVKNLLGEERAEAHLELKKVVDKQISVVCE